MSTMRDGEEDGKSLVSVDSGRLVEHAYAAALSRLHTLAGYEPASRSKGARARLPLQP